MQAAIAACHALAPSYDETDWDAIVSWYDVLLTLDPVRWSGSTGRPRWPSATARRPAWPWSTRSTAWTGYALWHATRGVLLRRLDREAEAVAADARAAALPLNDAQRSLLGR